MHAYDATRYEPTPDYLSGVSCGTLDTMLETEPHISDGFLMRDLKFEIRRRIAACDEMLLLEMAFTADSDFRRAEATAELARRQDG